MSKRRQRSSVPQKTDELIIQGRNKKYKFDDLRAVSNFLKNAHEDVLFEIFVRLPECRSAIYYGSVCRRWHSVISHPQFIPSFIRQQDCNTWPCTIIFYKIGMYVLNYQPVHMLQSKDSNVLHGQSTISSYLDFMPCRSFIIWASSDDLLLVSPDATPHRVYYICNPVTKQSSQLPETCAVYPVGSALVCNNQLGCVPHQYKVVLIGPPYDSEDGQYIMFNLKTFCFGSGQWILSSFSYPRTNEIRYNSWLDVVTCNGTLYWRESDFCYDGIVALDVFNNRCDFIKFPDDLVRGWHDSYGKVWIGVVRKALRLSQVFKPRKKCLVMKVWELRSSSWVLVHETNMTRPNRKRLVRLSFHPNNGDMVYMMWGRYFFQYTITKDVYTKIDKLHESINQCDRIFSVPVVNPPWPNRIPSIPTI